MYFSKLFCFKFRNGLALIFLALFLCQSAWCEKNYGIEIEAFSGIKNGMAKEFQIPKIKEEYKTISELDWHFSVPYIGVSVKYNYKNFIVGGSGDFSMSALLPSLQKYNQNFMEDFDWMNLMSTGENYRTHYSWNKNKAEYFSTDSCFVGYKWDLDKGVSVAAYGEYLFETFSFCAFDGFKQYGAVDGSAHGYNCYLPWSADLEKKSLEGTMVTLDSKAHFLGIGSQIVISPEKNNFLSKCTFSLGESFLVALYALEKDSHLKRKPPKIIGFDSAGAVCLETNGKIDFALNNTNLFTVGGDFIYRFKRTGPYFEKGMTENDSEWTSFKNLCLGAFSIFYYTFSLGYTCNL